MKKGMLVIAFLALGLISCGKEEKNLLGPDYTPTIQGPYVEYYSVNTNDQVYNRLRRSVLECLYVKIRNTGNVTLYGLKATLYLNDLNAAIYPAPEGMTAYFKSEDGSDCLIPGEISRVGIPNDDTGTSRPDFPSFYVQTSNPFTSPVVEFTLNISDSSGNSWSSKFYLNFR